ncbi:hypothetical protein SPRG_19902 [Saprolegnia parasitica CBS 223.65]|uniref:RNase NYN domain-containing protein n=1 Tax=Saprolegnia parasitica (strain CBS 223.65) TaxID=695850 RepID=A0A067CRV2_SAPPC|nr:hypothetical protein SPRG_19902 [Saprolegnia parasitica CBS 223.65]KDO29236.1 hypothetical protein SPRG_19902 [Saprolegnia parasitica CBS 223.65]|eukprot:XP_012200129.1 hypothetical protein SPRG_19902 [Saprolegnia parasitica CBS 223.65]
MSEDGTSSSHARSRYRKKPADKVDDARLYVPEAAPKKPTPRGKQSKKAKDNDLSGRMQEAMSMDGHEIDEQRKSRELHVQKQRKHRKTTEDERKKREHAQALMIKRVEKETIEKLSRAEVMFSLLQEHKQTKPPTKTASPTTHATTRAHDEGYPFGFNPAGVQPDELLPRIKRWEEHLKRLLGAPRTPQPYAIVSDHERGINCLRLACRDAYVELLLRHPDVARRMDVNERLWMNWYREIDGAQAAFRANGSSLPVRDALAALLATCTSFYHKLLGALQAASSAPLAVHATLVALGDLSRYAQGLLPKASRNWALAAVHYKEALSQLPSNGKVFNQLALLALHNNNSFEACYLYARSLAVTTPFRARENLMTTLSKAEETGRKHLRDLDGLGVFKARFLVGASILYSGVDVVARADAFTACVESLAAVVPLGGASTSSLLLQTMLFSLFLVHNTQVAIGHPEIQDPCFDTEWRHWHDHEVVHVALRWSFRLTSVLLLAMARSPTDALLQTCLPSVTIVLDWLRSHAWFFEWKDDSVVELQAALMQLVPVLHAKKDALLHDHWDGHRAPVPEDLELRGFLPCAAALHRRVGSDTRLVDVDDAPLSLYVARALGFVDFATDLDWMRPVVLPRVPPSLSVVTAVDRLCPQCSNSIVRLPCGFCGYESDEADVAPRVSARALTPGRGVLANVNLNVAKPTKPKRPSQLRQRPVPTFGGCGYASPNDPKCLIVVDAANVAMRHGLNARFSCAGIRLVFDYYLARGHKVLAFLPDYLLRYESVGAQKRMAGAGYDVSPSKLPDDVGLLQSMVLEGTVIATPPQDYDDSYCIQYAGRHDGCVVTNDLFRDHVDGLQGTGQQKAAMRQWLSAHCISFTWVGDEFLPNPDFRFPQPSPLEDAM